jgi:hypothetical protein
VRPLSVPKFTARLATVLSVCVFFLDAQPAVTISDHIVWEHDFPGYHADVLGSAVSDRDGVLWLTAHEKKSHRLLRISPDGQLLSSADFPASLAPQPPAELVYFHLAVSPSGTLGILAHYLHGGRNMFFDGAKFVSLGKDGTASFPKTVAGPGPEYKGFFALSDEDDFIVMGDQEPMIVIRIGPSGDLVWRKEFPRNWDLPSGAALKNGASCIASPAYAAPRIHVIQLDSLGNVRHRAAIAARRAETVAGPAGQCAVLYDREPDLKRGEFFLTSFDSTFRREWTVPVRFPAPQGGVFQFLAVKDGYLVAAMANNGFFLAKYDFAGQLVWSALDPSRYYAALACATGEGFYLVGAGPKDRYNFHVILGK